MLEKIRLSIVQPEGLIKYRKDKFYKVLLYTLFFALFMATASVVSTVTFDGLSPSVKQSMREDFNVSGVPCEIVDAEVMCEGSVTHTYYQSGVYAIHLNANETVNYEGNTYHFILEDDKLSVVFMDVVVQDKLISEMHPAMHNLDLTLDTLTETELMDAFFLGIDYEMTETKALWGSVLALGRILSAMLLFHFFILVNTFLIRLRLRMIPFKELYVMFAYASTLLYVVLIFDSIIALNFFLFLLLLFVAFRQTSRLALNLQNRIAYNIQRQQKQQAQEAAKEQQEKNSDDEGLNHDADDLNDTQEDNQQEDEDALDHDKSSDN